MKYELVLIEDNFVKEFLWKIFDTEVEDYSVEIFTSTPVNLVKLLLSRKRLVRVYLDKDNVIEKLNIYDDGEYRETSIESFVTNNSGVLKSCE